MHSFETISLGFWMPSGWEWIIILVIALLIFGKRLPEVGKSLGKGIVEFKKGLKGVKEELDEVEREVDEASREDESETRKLESNEPATPPQPNARKDEAEPIASSQSHTQKDKAGSGTP